MAKSELAHNGFCSNDGQLQKSLNLLYLIKCFASVPREISLFHGAFSVCSGLDIVPSKHITCSDNCVKV